MTERIIYPEDINYVPKYSPNGKSSYSKLSAQEGSQSISITIGGGQSHQFEISANSVYNLSKSYLQFTTQPSAVPTVGNYYYAHTSTCAPIDHIQLFTKSNVSLVDMYDVNRFLKALPYRMSYEDFKNRDFLAITGGEVGQYPHISNKLASANKSPVADSVTATGALSTLNYTGCIKVQETSAQNAQNPIITWQLMLGDLIHSICELNKKIYFPETIYLKIWWASALKIYWETNATNSPATAITPISVPVTLSSLNLYMDQEYDPLIIEKIKEENMKYPLWFDYTTFTSKPLSSTVQVNSIRIDSSYGLTLKRCYYSVFNNTYSSNTAFDNANIIPAGARYGRITSFHTELDSKRLQQFDMTTNIYEDYKALESKLLRKSAVQNVDEYTQNMFWVDFWDNGTIDHLDNVEQGLRLNKERIYQFSASTDNASLTHNCYIVCQRKLIMKEGLILLDNSL